MKTGSSLSALSLERERKKWIMGGSKTSNSCELTGVETCTLQLFQPLLPQLLPFVLTTHPVSHCNEQKQQT